MITGAVSIRREKDKTLVPSCSTWLLLCSHSPAKKCSFTLWFFSDFGFFFLFTRSWPALPKRIQGLFALVSCEAPPAHAAPALVPGWCLPVPDPEQELHCPSRCPGQRGIVLHTSSSQPPHSKEPVHPNQRRCSIFKNKSRMFPFC